MNILGLNLTIKNPAACLLKDGNISAFAEEERFIGLKGATNQMPIRALSFCLKEGKISPDEIDGIAVGWDAYKYRFKMPLFSAGLALQQMLKSRTVSTGGAGGLIYLLENTPGHRKFQVEMMLRKLGLQGKCPEINFFEHHLAHAASAYYCSPFDQAAILTMDGSGENHCTALYHGNSGNIISKQVIKLPNSLGWFYTAITEFLGFEPYEGEYKVMGLAPYGKMNDELMTKIEKIVKTSNNSYEIDPSYLLFGNHTYGAWFSDRMVRLFGIMPRNEGELEEIHKDIAYCAQHKLEEIALRLAKQITENGRIKKLCLAGGVALNCKMAGKILESNLVDEVFVQPVSYDSGCALGAALLLAKEKNELRRHELKSVYFGPGYSNEIVESKLKTSGLDYDHQDNPSEFIAEKIARGKIVGWFQGRMESGPRALGNRSILANPTMPRMKDMVNMAVKFREPWRPFTPSLLEEAKSDFLVNSSYAPFMTITFRVKEEKAKSIPAVTHVDGTTRPQTVRKNVNPLYWDLIHKIGEKTGVPVVLNTSLNIKGKPIACSPTQAIECFTTTGLDILVINNYVVEKN